MSKVEAATAVAKKLIAAEQSIDATMTAHAQLLQQMIEARNALGISGTVGELAQARVCESLAALSEARRATMAAHAALANVQQALRLELETVLPEKPPEEPKKPNVDLRAVS